MRGLSLPRVRRLWLVVAVLLVLVLIGGYSARTWYNHNLSAVSSSDQVTYFTVAQGTSLHKIAADLKQLDLIRSATAFETYVRGRHLYAKMQAGTYALRPSMSTPQIVTKLTKGDVSKTDVTIYPGKNLKQIRQIFKQTGYSEAELDAAFDPATYPDAPVLNYLPAGASLEGFLYPDTFQKEATTPASSIIRQSLGEMQSNLTPDIIAGFKSQGLSVYQGLTLASIVYQESGLPAAEPTVAQVFELRLKQGMMLGSDVTAFYGSQQAGRGQDVTYDTAYNTRIHSGLPPGPIGNMTVSALQAVAHPSNSDFLFFVAGDDGTIHFSHTDAEHQQAIKQYCHKLCDQ
jgi:UPF0755 protein